MNENGNTFDDKSTAAIGRAVAIVLDQSTTPSPDRDERPNIPRSMRAVLVDEVIAGDETPAAALRLTWKTDGVQWVLVSFYELDVEGSAAVSITFTGPTTETVLVDITDGESDLVAKFEAMAAVGVGNVDVIVVGGRVWIGFDPVVVDIVSLAWDLDDLVTGNAWVRKTQWIPDRHEIPFGVAAVIDFDDPDADPDDDDTWPRFAAGTFVTVSKDSCPQWLIDAASCREFSRDPNATPTVEDPEEEGI